MFNKLNEILLISQGVSTMNYFKDVTNDGPIKAFTCFSTAFISWLLGTFTPLWTILFIIFLLILTDMILGCKVSLINNSKLESRKFWKTLRKFCWCCAIIWFSHEIDKDIFTSFNAHLVEFFSGAIAGVELWSILENLTALHPDGPWKLLNKFIKSKGEKYLDITIDREDLPKVKGIVKKIK